MLVKFTKEERQEIDALEKKYKELFADLDAQSKKIAIEYSWPDTERYFDGLDAIKNPNEWQAAWEKENAAIAEWEKSAPGKWIELRDAHAAAIHNEYLERNALFEKCEQRQFAELGNDLARIMADAKDQAPQIIESIHKSHREQLSDPNYSSYSAIDVVSLGDGKWQLDAERTRGNLSNALHLHFSAFLGKPELIEELTTFIRETVANDPRVAPEGTPGRGAPIVIKKPKSVKPVLIDIDLHLHDESKPAKVKQPRTRKGTIPGQLTIWDSWEAMGYYPMLQSPGYNSLIHSMGARPDRVDMLGTRKIERNGMTVSITGLPDSIKKLPTSAAKLLDMFQIKATQGGIKSDRVVALPLDEYMEIRNLRDKKEAREQVKRDLELLQRVDVKFNDWRHSFLTVSLSGGTRGIVNGVIGFKFNEDWLKLFPLNNQIMPMPKGLFATNDNANPHAYYFGRAISEHRRMNDGKCNECTISVKTLVKASPTFPTYESIGDAKQIEKRIIGPFERDLEAAAQATGGKFYWNYAGVNTEDPPATYADFIDAKIFITWNEYPDTDTINRGRKHYKKMASKGKLKGKKASG
ncbi:MAG: hypothetical protein EOM08_07305 [Clostridia bacterium]|nr:hypothetical protein [Clostridia bacterium]